MEKFLSAVDSSNLWSKTYATLKDNIIKRHFKPNQKILINEVAKQLKVSRTPVRDALNRLEMEGLVWTEPKVGTFVVPIDEKLINCAIDTRLMIELWVVEKLPNLPQERIDNGIHNMKILLNNAESDYDKDFKTYHELDYNLKFHMEYVKIGGNYKNDEIYGSILNYRLPVTIPKHVLDDEVEKAIRQHRDILDSLSSADYLKLREKITFHLEESRINIIKKIRKNGGEI